MSNSGKKIIGVLGDMQDPNAIIHAAEKIRDAGYTKWDIHVPYPVHGLDKAMGEKRTTLPRFSLTGGATGLTLAFLLQWYTGAFHYKLNIGGKPFFAPQFGMPVFFEMTVLFTAFTTIFVMFGYFLRLPKWWSPFQHDAGFQRALDDNFCIVLDAEDARFNAETAQSLLNSVHANNVRVVYEA